MGNVGAELDEAKMKRSPVNCIIADKRPYYLLID